MAIYHLHVKVIGRKAGSSAVASAAYRSASRLRDNRIERDHDFSNKRGVVHSEVLLPENAPEHWSDRERLWNDVEAFEARKDAQLAREVEFAIPREMNEAQGIELARGFAQSEFVDQGMIADLNVHWDFAEDGSPKAHAHVMLTMRSVDESGFGSKVRDWNRTEMVERWRERWAEHVNERLAELDIDARIDHRSLEAQGVGLEPQTQIGAPAKRIEIDGIEAADRADMHREIARNNGERIIADPHLALDAITHQQSTFTRRDMAKFAHRHSDGIEQFNEVMGAMRGSPDLVELGNDSRGVDRFMVERGDRSFAAGDRVMFLQNERGLGVNNGTLGTIEEISTQSMTVRTDDGHGISFDLKDYDHIDHGYAATIHKAQGMTVDRTHVLATPGLDAHGSYVALSRHRDGMNLHYGRDDFANQDNPEEALRRARRQALVRHARASETILEAKRQGLTLSVEQRRELGAARHAFEDVRPHGWQDAEAAYSKDNSLAREAGTGRISRAVRALQLETELRTDPQRRADRFVERWQKLDRAGEQKYAAGDYSGYKAARAEMGNMAKSLERDPQLESLLANRKRELGIDFDSGCRLGRELAFHHGIDLGRGRGIGL